jgi:hypothetical protein
MNFSLQAPARPSRFGHAGIELCLAKGAFATGFENGGHVVGQALNHAFVRAIGGWGCFDQVLRGLLLSGLLAKTQDVHWSREKVKWGRNMIAVVASFRARIVQEALLN